jgi:hypothetical protein
MTVLLIQKNNGRTVLEDSGRNAALEVAGNIESIIRRP